MSSGVEKYTRRNSDLGKYFSYVCMQISQPGILIPDDERFIYDVNNINKT